MGKLKSISREDVLGIEAKHITHVNSKNGKDDLHVVKEVVHLKDGTRIPRLRTIENYKRPFWVTQKGRQNHTDKKDYEFVRNLDRYMCTQRDLNKEIQQKVNGFVSQGWVSTRQVARSPYLYGVDVTSVNCLKYDYRKAYPDLISPNSVAGGDIETNVYEVGMDGEIICMSVTFKDKAYIAYLKKWVDDIEDVKGDTLKEIQNIPEVKALFEGRGIQLEIEVVDNSAKVVIECIRRLHEWKPDFFSFWNMDFDMSKIINCLDYYGIDKAEVFSDPSLPPHYKHFHYKRDEASNESVSGVNKTKDPADQWHWVTAPASFQCIDAMSTYRLTRLAGGKAPSYSLDYTLSVELAVDESMELKSEDDLKSLLKELDRITSKRPGSYPYYFISDPKNDTVQLVHVDDDEDGNPIYEEEVLFKWDPVDTLVWNENCLVGLRARFTLDYGKLSFPEADHKVGVDWHREMQTKHKIKYGVYNLVDSIRLEQLDEHIDDLASNITLYSKYSDYRNFNSNPRRLCVDMHFWYLERPDACVMASSSDEQVGELDQWIVGAGGWIKIVYN